MLTLKGKRLVLAKSQTRASFSTMFYRLLVIWLLLDRFDAPGWVWGVFYSFCFVALIIFIDEIKKTRPVSIQDAVEVAGFELYNFKRVRREG